MYKKIFLTIFSIIFLLIALALFYNQLTSQNLFFSNETVNSFPYVDFIVTVLCMSIGILFGSFYNQIKNKERITSFKKEIKSVFKSSHLIRSFLIAPIIFIAVYKAAGTYPDIVLAALFSFQNGFFCDSILRNKNEGQDNTV